MKANLLKWIASKAKKHGERRRTAARGTTRHSERRTANRVNCVNCRVCSAQVSDGERAASLGRGEERRIGGGRAAAEEEAHARAAVRLGFVGVWHWRVDRQWRVDAALAARRRPPERRCAVPQRALQLECRRRACGQQQRSQIGSAVRGGERQRG